ncbi:suppressor of fused domain protein [Methylovorus menthalis]|uniref:suppressor of fused domain protein n=1 Tax=Methylovorus menthalis TaxID=1002227 RepID=UPI001E50C9EB|nr:suppressor of fused domain protein [Methylovorus menthalis]MCB4811062.1 suppressor of fused domain protein [Methylovorus menthalis]
MIIDHYFKKFGSPSREAEFSTQKNSIKVLKWDQDKTGEGVAIYATEGASNIHGDENNGCEFFLGIAPEVDDVVDAIAEAALHGNGTLLIPNSGDSINLSYPLWVGTEAHSFMFTNGDEIIEPINIVNKKIIFIQLVPIFESELKYKNDHSEIDLWKRFEALEVAYWNAKRKQAF